MAKKADKQRTVTPVCRLSFPSLWKAKAFKNQEPKFQATLLFGPKADMAGIKKAIFRAKKAGWGDDKAKWPKMENPLHNGDKKADLDGYKGTTFLVAKNKYKPQVKDRDGTTDLIEVDNKIQAGDYVRCLIRAYPYGQDPKSGLKPGIAFSLDAVQFHSQGERFTGMGDAGDYFEPMEDDEDSEENFEDEDADSDDSDDSEDDEDGDEGW